MTVAEPVPAPAAAAAPAAAETPVKLVSRRDLFVTPLFTFTLDGCEDLNRRLMLDIAKVRQQSPEGIRASNQHGWHSERDFFTRSEPSFLELKKHIFTAMGAAVSALNPSLERSRMSVQAQGWINVSERGAFNAPHDHPHYLLSGVYYVQVPDHDPAKDPNGRSGIIEFLDSRGLSLQAKAQEMYLGTAKQRVRPVVGTMLIFPANLSHWVYPHEEDSERVSIAFNMRFGAATVPKARKPAEAATGAAPAGGSPAP